MIDIIEIIKGEYIKKELLKYEKYIISNNIKWSFIDTKINDDNRDIIVFFHGYTSNKIKWLYGIINELKNNYRIISIDLIGHGNTTLLNPIKEYNLSIINQIKEIFIVINYLTENKKFHVIGTSYGGFISNLFASTYPNFIKTIILICPFGLTNDANNSIIKYYIQTGKFYFDEYNNHNNDYYYKIIEDNKPNFLSINFIKFIINIEKNNNNNKELRYFLMYNNFLPSYHNFYRQIKQNNIPTIAIFGEKDSMITLRSSIKGLKLKNKNSKIFIIRNGNHLIPINNYKSCSKIILDTINYNL